MKNIFILTIIFISSFIPVFSKEEFICETTENISSYKVYKTIDFKQENKKAKNIFYKYLLKENDITKKQYKNMCNNSSYCYIKADEIDLNNDGINEIIGYESGFCGVLGCGGYILQKQQNKWKNILYFNFSPFYNIDILENKNENYYDIRPTSIDVNYTPWSDAPYQPYIIRYKDNGYNLVITNKKGK